MKRATRRAAAALLAGVALGATGAAGVALLLYTGHGFLRAAGLLVSSTIMAVAAGVWAGAPDPDQRAPSARLRWIGMIAAVLLGGAFAMLWGTRAPLREIATGGAFAVLLIIALPAYSAGTLLVGLHAVERAATPRHTGAAAATGTAGAALGVLLATTILIQTLEAYGIYFAAAALLAFASLLDSGADPEPVTESAMHDSVVLITGAGHAGQLGQTLVRRFLQLGARVLMTDRTPGIDEAARQLAAHGDVIGVEADLTVEEDLARLMATVRERFGRLDALINTAGGLTVMKPVGETTAEEWQRELQRNAETVLRMSRAALPLLRESGGAIVNFASPAGVRAARNLGAYSAAKAAVIALTRSMALEEKAAGVRVNAVAPGTMDTRQNVQDAGGGAAVDGDAGVTNTADGGADGEHDAVAGGEQDAAGTADSTAFVSRDDVASVVVFLAGPQSRGVSGETIHVMGPTLA